MTYYFIVFEILNKCFMHISCTRHLGLENDQAIVVTLEIKSKIANVLSASKLLLEEYSCAQLCLA